MTRDEKFAAFIREREGAGYYFYDCAKDLMRHAFEAGWNAATETAIAIARRTSAPAPPPIPAADTPMSPEQLTTIEQRARSCRKPLHCEDVTYRDVPVLIAEVRRLQTVVEAQKAEVERIKSEGFGESE